jgi:cytochrome P450
MTIREKSTMTAKDSKMMTKKKNDKNGDDDDDDDDGNEEPNNKRIVATTTTTTIVPSSQQKQQKQTATITIRIGSQEVGKDSMKSLIYISIIINATNSAIKSFQEVLYDDDNDNDNDNDNDGSSSSSMAMSSLPSILFNFSLIGNIIICIYFIKCLINEIYFLFCVRPYLPPGSLGLPFVGSLPSVLYKYSHLKNLPLNGKILFMIVEMGNKIRREREQLEKDSNNNSMVFMTCILGRRLITLGDTQSISWLWNNDRKSMTEVAWPPNISMLLGSNAAANSVGAHHRSLRRIMEPFYLPKYINNYVNIVTKTTDEALDKYYNMCCSNNNNNNENNNGFVRGEVFKLYALRVFMISSFGEVCEKSMKELHDSFLIWINGFSVLTGTLRIPGGKFDLAMQARTQILLTCKKLVDKFKIDNPSPDSDRSKNTVIGKMIYSKITDPNGIGLSEDEILDNLLLLIFAGHDTTYASINTVLHHITQNPYALNALQEEISSLKFNTNNDSDDKLDYDQLKEINAPVLNAIMYESWRIDPPVSAGFRKLVKTNNNKTTTVSDNNGYQYPIGTIFNYNINLASHDETLYGNANSFQFERFLPVDHPLYKNDHELPASSNSSSSSSSNYPIFGGGTHGCLGKNFAKLELRIILVRMLQRYNLKVRNYQKIHVPVNGWSIEFQLTKKEEKKKN